MQNYVVLNISFCWLLCIKIKSERSYFFFVRDISKVISFVSRQDLYSDTARRGGGYPVKDRVVEHQFEIGIENISGFKLLDNMIWGEADTFVQYHFPAQGQLKQQGVDDITYGKSEIWNSALKIV